MMWWWGWRRVMWYDYDEREKSFGKMRKKRPTWQGEERGECT